MKNNITVAVVTVLFLIPLIAFPNSMLNIFQTAQGTNITFLKAQLDLQLKEMNYDKSVIQASGDEGMKLNAELSYNSGLMAYQGNLKKYYSEVYNSIFNVIESNINLEIGKANLDIATINLQNNESLFSKSLISENDLKKSKLNLSNSQNQLANLQWTYNNSLKDYKNKTGEDWKNVEIEVYNYESLPASETIWLKNDFNVKIADLNLQIAQYNVNNLSSSTAEYSKKTAEIQLEKAKLSYKDAVYSSKNNFVSSYQNIQFLYKSVLNSKDNLSILNENLMDTKQKYDKGLISETSYLNQHVQYLTAEKNYYQSLNNYYNALFNYIISMGLDPEKVLK